jgi:antitoxin FitA
VPAVLALLAQFCDDVLMATIVIRNLDPAVKRRLQVRAAENGRSMEAEARAFLSEGLAEKVTIQPSEREVDLGTAIHRRFAALGGVDLKLPSRRFSNRQLPKFD